MKFEIPGKLPGLNDIIAAAKSHYGEYAKMKEKYTSMVALLARKLPKCNEVALIVTWYEPDRRRDIDNIMAGQKFIMDGLVEAGAILNDSQRYIKGIMHRFEVDKKNPRVEVEIVEVGKDPGEFAGQEL